MALGKYLSKFPLTFLALLTMGAFVGCSSSAPNHKVGELMWSDNRLMAAGEIDGVKLPAGTRYFGVRASGYPDLKIENAKVIETLTCGKQKVAVYTRFNSQDLFVSLLQSAKSSDLSPNPNWQAQIIPGAADHLKLWAQKKRFELQCVSETTFGVQLITSDGRDPIYLFKEAGTQLTMLPYRWQRVGTLAGLPSYFTDIPNSKLKRIYSKAEQRPIPGFDNKDEEMGYTAQYARATPEAQRNGELFWLGVRKNSAGSALEFIARDKSGALLIDEPLVSVFTKEFPIISTLWTDEKSNMNLFVGQTSKGKSVVFVAEPRLFEKFKVFSSEESAEKALGPAMAYLDHINQEAVAYIAADRRAAAEAKRKYDAIARNVEMTLFLMGSQPNEHALISTWESVHRQCQDFPNNYQAKPEPCKIASEKISALKSARESARRAKYLQEEAEWKSRMANDAKNWDDFQKKMGISSQHGISGSSRMLHDQMLRNGYRWVKPDR